MNMYGKQEAGIFTVHAEEALIAKAMKLKALQRFGCSKLNVLVVRWKPSIEALGNARPCSKCRHLLKMAGLNRVYYSDENGVIQRL